MSHIHRHTLRLSLSRAHSKSMHGLGLGNLVLPTVQYLCRLLFPPLALRGCVTGKSRRLQVENQGWGGLRFPEFALVLVRFDHVSR